MGAETDLSWIDGQPFWSLLELQQRGVVTAARMLGHYTADASPQVELCIRILQGVVRVVDDAAGSSERSKPVRILGTAIPFVKPEHPFMADHDIKYLVVPKEAISGLLAGKKKRVGVGRFPAGYYAIGGNGYCRVEAYKRYIGGDPFDDWPNPGRFGYVVYQTENLKKSETIPGEGPTPLRVSEDRLVVYGQELKAYLMSGVATAAEPHAETQREGEPEIVKGAVAELLQFVEIVKQKAMVKGMSISEERMPRRANQLKNVLQSLAASKGYVYWSRSRHISTFWRCTEEAGIGFEKGRPRGSKGAGNDGVVSTDFYAELFAEEIGVLRDDGRPKRS